MSWRGSSAFHLSRLHRPARRATPSRDAAWADMAACLGSDPPSGSTRFPHFLSPTKRESGHGVPQQTPTRSLAAAVHPVDPEGLPNSSVNLSYEIKIY